MLFQLFWSECRDSNSRPLEPHSSAIPNFATPGYLVAHLSAKVYYHIRFRKSSIIFPNFKKIFRNMLCELEYIGSECRASFHYEIDATKLTSSNILPGVGFRFIESLHDTVRPSVEIRYTMVSMRSSPHRADVHQTSAFNFSNLDTKEKS